MGIDTHGPRAAVALGGILMGLGWLSASAAASVWMLYLLCGCGRCRSGCRLRGAGALAGPQFAGFIRTATGGWTGVFPYVAVITPVGCLIALAVLREE